MLSKKKFNVNGDPGMKAQVRAGSRYRKAVFLLKKSSFPLRCFLPSCCSPKSPLSGAAPAPCWLRESLGSGELPRMLRGHTWRAGDAPRG